MRAMVCVLVAVALAAHVSAVSIHHRTEAAALEAESDGPTDPNAPVVVPPVAPVAPVVTTPPAAPVDPDVWVVKPLTAADSFTFGIEGPAVDAKGFVYAQNFKAQHTLGRVDPATGAGAVWMSYGTGVGSGMRIDATGSGYVTDYKTHSIWKLNLEAKTKTLFAQSNAMTQPNDLTLQVNAAGATVTVWASDPNFGKNTGRVWRIRKGKVELAAQGLGPSNGIDLSPDGTKLYVNEAFTGADKKAGNSARVWEFTVAADPALNLPVAKALTNKRLVGEYAAGGCDGMRVDVDGNLYMTRNPGGVINKIDPKTGAILHTVQSIGTFPANICFGGADGKTAYVTEEQFKRIITFRTDSAGLEWARLHPKA